MSAGNSDRRFFNAQQRSALFEGAHGRCEKCSRPLGEDWHADHRVPFSKGGRTDVLNGQALCAKCNLGKGGSSRVPMWSLQLRAWQQNAFRHYMAAAQRDYLLVACPGGGKTITALRFAHSMLESGEVDRLVVVVPTEHLKKQWAKEAAKCGINLRPYWSQQDGDFESDDEHGIAATYQQVFSADERFRRQCVRPTLAIFDEIHHAGDGLGWGDSLRRAFEPARRRVSLSGTPFRQDNYPIPFCQYVDGTSKADFPYPYGSALADGVVRPILFPSFEGRMEWLHGDEFREHSFADKLSDRDRAHRMRTALDVKLDSSGQPINGGWVCEVLEAANAKLEEIRDAGHHDAGGLILTMGAAHARIIALALRHLTGEEPAVVLSEEPEAGETLDAFQRGSRKWLIAVRMVSEGVDIRRLRVLVYATNIMTELFFRQAAGRIVRNIDGLEEQSAYFFIPAAEELIAHAQKIKEERDHQLRAEIERLRTLMAGSGLPDGSRVFSGFVPIAAEAREHHVFVDEDVITQEELAHARRTAPSVDWPRGVPLEVLAKVIRAVSVSSPGGSASAESVAVPAVEPMFQRKKALSSVINQMVAQYAAMTGKDFKDINYALMARVGEKRGRATVDQLEQSVKLLQQWMTEAGNG